MPPSKAFKVLAPSTPGSLRPFSGSTKRSLSKKKTRSAKKQHPGSQIQSQTPMDEEQQHELLLLQQQQL